jgi:hypothetical protein
MEDLRATTLTGRETTLSAAAVEAFKQSLRGPLIAPDDARYAEARKVWNGMIDRRPALIARCAGVADVISAVQFARTYDLLVAVRGGGHSVAGHAVCDGGLMLDLSCMKGLRVDLVHRTVHAQPGLTLGEFDRSAGDRPHGVSHPSDRVATSAGDDAAAGSPSPRAGRPSGAGVRRDDSPVQDEPLRRGALAPLLLAALRSGDC